jgi:hypothetical protein
MLSVHDRRSDQSPAHVMMVRMSDVELRPSAWPSAYIAAAWEIEKFHRTLGI